jgi:hypothetical protein
MRAVGVVLALVVLAFAVVVVFDASGISDRWAAHRAVAEAEKLRALSELERARADTLLAAAAAGAVRADTFIASAAVVALTLVLMSVVGVAFVVVTQSRRDAPLENPVTSVHRF